MKIQNFIKDNYTMEEIKRYQGFIATRIKRIDTYQYNENHVYHRELKNMWFNECPYNSSFNGFCNNMMKIK